ncbi:hypothetical protein [Sphingobium sp. AntQ-1]|uniref:hypothetical protein n=1 Tax=Sphingobium sp. AntQ-1 TaxID=2930091 RepID=UPI00234EEBE2|nr:hypothetical protein [Sphingobium sp. AntQ-1]
MSEQGKRWCILRTLGRTTINLAAALTRGGFDVWTPKRTIRRPAPGERRELVLGQRRRMIEVAVPIMSGFVFVREGAEDDLVRFARSPANVHLPFVVMQRCGHAALVSEASVAGLRDAERSAEAVAQAERDAESREDARRLRVERLGSERARIKALRQVRRSFTPGEQVTVSDSHALQGLEGIVLKSDGTKAEIDFGGVYSMTVEAWRILPVVLRTDGSHMSDAA